jgi:hypothetical protein
MATVAGRLVYRPTLTRVLAGCYLVFGVWLLVSVAAVDGATATARTLGWLVAVGVVVHAILWRPAVIVDEGGVELVNLVRTVHVPWAALEAVDTRFALTLTADGRRYASWAASAPGRTGSALRPPGAWRASPGQARGAGPQVLPDPRWLPGVVGAGRASRDLRSGSGAAAFMVEHGWAGWRDRPPAQRLAEQEAGPVVAVRWSRPLIGVELAAVAGILVTSLIG